MQQKRKRGNFIDLTGLVFGKLTVLGMVGTDKHRQSVWECQCECGNTTKVLQGSLKRGATTSCGCVRDRGVKERSTKHGLSAHPLYVNWVGMIARVTNPNSKDYKDYGARGIEICKEWYDIENFIFDMFPSYKEGLTLDRIDVNGNYCKENCRWATNSMQAHGKRKRAGCTSQYIGVSFSKIANRFVAHICIDANQQGLGYFDDEYSAAVVYDNHSDELYGDRPNGTPRTSVTG